MGRLWKETHQGNSQRKMSGFLLQFYPPPPQVHISGMGAAQSEGEEGEGEGPPEQHSASTHVHTGMPGKMLHWGRLGRQTVWSSLLKSSACVGRNWFQVSLSGRLSLAQHLHSMHPHPWETACAERKPGGWCAVSVLLWRPGLHAVHLFTIFEVTTDSTNTLHCAF